MEREAAPLAPQGAVVPPSARPRRRWLVLMIAVVVVAATIGATYVFGLFPFAGNAPAVNHPPVAVIQASDLAPATYEPVTLNGSASHDPDGDALTYAWVVAGGSNSTARTTELTLTSVGTFRVTLTVSDGHGGQGSANVSLTTHPAVLHVGTNTPFPPFEFYGVSSNLEGFDIDLVDNATARLAYRPVWSDVSDFSVLLSDVSSGGLDMGASAITSSGLVGASRNATMYFSIPYYVVDFGVLVRSSSNLTCPSTGCTPANLANRTVGVVSGTSEEVWVQDQLVSPGYTPSSYVQAYSGVTVLLSALASGAMDMAILDSPTAAAAANGTSLRVAGVIHTGEQYSLAFPKDAAGLALRDRMNVALQAMMADGTLQAIDAKWLGP